MQNELLEGLLYNGTTWLVIIGGACGLWGAIYWHKMSPAARLGALKHCAILAVLVGMGLWLGYQRGADDSIKSYRFLTYIDGMALETAKDMQAMCDQRKICKADEIQARWEDATGLGKIAAGLH